MNGELPAFAIVGHPNKGKSSLVSTLARDPSVAIGPDPGTTRRAREFPLRIRGEVLYTLIDTPGFQRARAALDWMREHEAGAASRPAVVSRFVQRHEGEERFHDECELLRPIVEGAGIIYVVDGASPFGPEYEPEMEILRWTGQPSMAIINPIGTPKYVDSWQDALGQFFRIVRVVDVLQAPFEQQVNLLRAFGQLRESWAQPLDRAVSALVNHREQQRRDAARVIAELVATSLRYTETRDVAADAPTTEAARALEERYRSGLRRLEREARRQVELIYGYPDLDRQEEDFELLESDLLDRDTWVAFGLSRRDLIAVGAAGGALTGGVVDAGLLGASFFAGSIVGGLIGGVAGYMSAERLADVKVLRQSLGGQRLRCGPTRSLQFPFVLLGRARLHHAVVEARTHAQRQALVVSDESSGTLDESAKRRLAELFSLLRRHAPGEQRHVQALESLTDEVVPLLRPPSSEAAPASGAAH